MFMSIACSFMRKMKTVFIVSLLLFALIKNTSSRALDTEETDEDDYGEFKDYDDYGEYEDLDDEEKEAIPDSHIPRFKFERNGRKNEKYEQEVFLGGDIQEFDKTISQLSKVDKLKNIFYRVDSDSDSRISVEELADWIVKSTNHHIEISRQDTEEKFQLADHDEDGLITWSEYLISILSRHFDNKPENADNLEFISSKPLKHKLEALKTSWESASSNQTNSSLGFEKFFEFLHPEAGVTSVEMIIDKIMKQRDADKDGKLSVNEYIFGHKKAPAGGSDEQDMVVRNKLMEFFEFVDHDRDGSATPQELAIFLAADGKSKALNEAHSLLEMGDTDGDLFLTIEEILMNSEYFTGSKLCNYEQLDHQEL